MHHRHLVVRWAVMARHRHRVLEGGIRTHKHKQEFFLIRTRSGAVSNKQAGGIRVADGYSRVVGIKVVATAVVRVAGTQLATAVLWRVPRDEAGPSSRKASFLCRAL